MLVRDGTISRLGDKPTLRTVHQVGSPFVRWCVYALILIFRCEDSSRLEANLQKTYHTYPEREAEPACLKLHLLMVWTGIRGQSCWLYYNAVAREHRRRHPLHSTSLCSAFICEFFHLPASHPTPTILCSQYPFDGGPSSIWSPWFLLRVTSAHCRTTCHRTSAEFPQYSSQRTCAASTWTQGALALI